MAFAADHIAQTVQSALSAPVFRRVQAFDLPGGRIWLKRAERPSLRMRLQKGDPHRSIAVECEGLHLLADAGLPVPDLLDEGPDYLVLTDIGPDLATLALDPGFRGAGRAAAFAGAGYALAHLHWAGFAHGRPALRDMCWDGRKVRFIDLERFRPHRASTLRQALDLAVFVQACFTLLPHDRSGPDRMMAAYRSAAGQRVIDRARRLARSLGWLGLLARGLRRLQPPSRELRAIPLTLDYLGACSPAPRATPVSAA